MGGALPQRGVQRLLSAVIRGACLMRTGGLLAAVILAVVAAGCGGGAASKTEPESKTEPVPTIRDRTSMLPLTGRMATRTVPNHLLDLTTLPGGTLGDYESGGKKYQLFIIEAESNQKAAIL